MGVQAVIFDMDGLIFDTERLAAAGWVKAGKEMGFPISAEDTNPIRGVTQEMSRRLFRELLGEAFDYDKARGIRTAHIRQTIEEKGIPVKPGAEELLRYLKDAGKKTALATSSSREVAEGYLRRAGFTALFDLLVCGEDVQRSKPEPDVFLAAAKGVGVSPPDCLVLEDSPNGILAASRAGCPVIGVPDTIVLAEHTVSLCAAVCVDLYEVTRMLKAGWGESIGG